MGLPALAPPQVVNAAEGRGAAVPGAMGRSALEMPRVAHTLSGMYAPSLLPRASGAETCRPLACLPFPVTPRAGALTERRIHPDKGCWDVCAAHQIRRHER